MDECSLNTTACTHNCTNTNGSYGCACLDGYQLEADQHNCTGQYWVKNVWRHISVKITPTALVHYEVGLLYYEVGPVYYEVGQVDYEVRPVY